MKRTLIFSLLICLLLSCASCIGAKEPSIDTSDATDETRPTVSAAAAGLVSHGFVSEEDFPANARLTEWYADAIEREFVPCSVLYAKDETDGLWHCWVYLASWAEGDTVTFSADNTDGLCVIIQHKAATPDADGSTGATYFTVACDAAPAFDLLVNGEDEALIVTHADVSVSK